MTQTVTSWKELLHPETLGVTDRCTRGGYVRMQLQSHHTTLAGVRPQDQLKRAFGICTHQSSSWVSLYRGSTQQSMPRARLDCEILREAWPLSRGCVGQAEVSDIFFKINSGFYSGF